MFTKWTLLAKGATCFCYTVSVMNNGLFIERIFELLSAVCFRCYFIQVNSLREKYGGGGYVSKETVVLRRWGKGGGRGGYTKIIWFYRLS